MERLPLERDHFPLPFLRALGAGLTRSEFLARAIAFKRRP